MECIFSGFKFQGVNHFTPKGPCRADFFLSPLSLICTFLFSALKPAASQCVHSYVAQPKYDIGWVIFFSFASNLHNQTLSGSPCASAPGFAQQKNEKDKENNILSEDKVYRKVASVLQDDDRASKNKFLWA